MAAAQLLAVGSTAANSFAVAVRFGNTSSISGSNSLGAQHVSENANVVALGAGTKYMGTAPQVLPYGATLRVDAAVRNAGGIPTICPTYDDGFLSQHQQAFPEYQNRSLKFTCMVPWGMIGLDGTRISGRMLIEELQEMYDAGVAAMCLDGTRDDALMTLRANPAAVVTELAEGKQWLVDHGLSAGALGWGWDAFWYPNGETDNNATRIQIAALTGDGSNNVVAGAAPATAVAVGMSMAGYGIPAGTTVTAVADTTHFTLSNPVPVQTKPALAVDWSGAFAVGKLQTALKAAGLKIGRTTLTGQEYTRFGFDADQGLMMNSNTATGQSAAQMQAVVDLAILRGTTAIIHIHNHDAARDIPFLDYLQAKQNANELRVLTLPELIARDYGSKPVA
ncbi:hypothetical protein [Rhizobium sp. 007]|uniref:hypothetical protein n=1 Tax=Rhizobium sp. 007 TaxID=2785056 RepID=UPI00188FA151|nr:hypothetical protein [Rhizobium sp. 007]QPB21755.1 hypothetical protein ISN39_10170 [Rhizobium sp. 007]